MNSSRLIKTFAITSLGLAIAACGSNTDSSANNTTNTNNTTPANTQTGTTPAAKASIQFVPKNLESLGDKYDYEGWIVKDGKPTSTGKFDIKKDKTTYSFDVDKSLVEGSATFVLSIEPSKETGEAINLPSNTKIIAGDILNSMATATTSHKAAFGTDFSQLAAGYVLATPTNNFRNPTQGIWFNNLSGFTELTGWKYEGWIVDANGPTTTGTFSKTNKPDDDGAGPAAGPNKNNFPSEPGQDFINPAKELVGTTVVISVEPDPDNSDVPFSIKPLIGKVTNEAGKRVLENKAADSLPSASIEVKL